MLTVQITEEHIKGEIKTDYSGFVVLVSSPIKYEIGDTKQTSPVKRLETTYQTCEKVQLGPSMDDSRALAQDLINSLPEGCIAEIFRHVEDPEDRQSCTTVCWKWAKLLVSLQPNFWGPFSVHQVVHPCLHLSGPDAVDSKLAAAVFDICSRDVVTDLDLRCVPHGVVGPGIPPLTDNGIDFVTSACRNLKLVCLDHCLSLTDKAARTIASNCPALQNLMLIQSCLSDDGISEVAKQCTNLNALHVEGGLSITEVSLRALAQDAKNLKSLTLGSCPLIIEDAVMSFLMGWPYLDKLELKEMMAGESDGSVSQAYQAVSEGERFNGAGWSSILHRSSYLSHELRSLILVKCSGLQDLSMFKLAHIRLPMLEHLAIEDCSGVTQIGLIYVVGHTVMLKTIKLARFHFSTYVALMEVLSLCNRTIESLSLDSCDFDQVMPLESGEAVSKECPQLEVIRLERCESIAQLFLAWIADVCRGLKELRMIGFSETAEEHDILYYLSSILYHNRMIKIELRSCQVTDIHVSIIIQFRGKVPHEFVLDACSHILGKYVGHLSVMCHNMVKSGLSGTQITDVKVRIPLDLRCKHLPEVRLMGCHMVTNTALHEITTSFLTRLRRMNLLVILASRGLFD